LKKWVFLLAGALLLQGCLVREARGDVVLFAHTWGSCLLLLLAILASGALCALCMGQDFLFAGRVAALSGMVSIVLAVCVAPNWLMDRIELDPTGIKVRAVDVSRFRVQRHEARWDALEAVHGRWGQSNSFTLQLYPKGRNTGPDVITLDKDTLSAILPDVRRLIRGKGLAYDDNL
jgi:hypothetical protein